MKATASISSPAATVDTCLAVAQTAPEVTAGEVMTSPVVTVPESGTIWDAWSVIVTCGVRHAVVTSGEHCIGVVDDRELVQAWQQGPTGLRSTAIKQLLHTRTSCVLPDAALWQVASLMNAERVDAVPVVDASGKLLGLITAGDIVHAVARLGLHDKPPIKALAPSEDA